MVKKPIRKGKKESKERKLEKELLWVVGFMVFLVLVFFVSSEVFKSRNRVEYGGLTFTKERAGNIPVFHYSYYYETPKNELIKYNLFVRNDPSTSQIPVEGKIVFDRGKKVYVTTDPTGISECSQSVLAVGSLTRFLSDNQFNVEAGYLDFFEAGRTRVENVDCKNKPNNTVISIKEGEETKITSTGNCIEVEVANCQVLEAVERLQVQSIIDAKEYVK